jgi:predicted ATPase
VFIKKVILENHPLIRDAEIIFSQPIARQLGSGLNYIVGPSGAGKTKFIQTFLPTSASSLSNSWRPAHKIDPSIYSAKAFDENDTQIANSRGTLKMQNIKDLNPDNSKKISRDYLFSAEEFSESNSSGTMVISLKARNRFNVPYPKNFNNSGSGEARFNVLMGLIEEFRLNPKYQIALIEEPETFLDPLLQLKLIDELAAVSEKKQLFISTHSPYIVSWNYLECGATIIKANRNANEVILGSFCDPALIGKINNPGRRNPQLNGVETKNIFFSNKVFVVEGQEDVGLISDHLSTVNYDFTFFGYGAGSNGKVQNILKLCSELKIPKVAALFDSNPKNSNYEYNLCKTEFPNFKIECLIAEDIRDKYSALGTIEKLGAFAFNPKTEHCSLKSDELGQDFGQKIESILQYFYD